MHTAPVILALILTAGMSWYFFRIQSKELPPEPTEEVKGLAITPPPPPPPVIEELKIEKKVFGKSTKGKVIEGYEIGSGEDVWLLFSSIHGDEIGTTDLLNALINEIQTNPSVVAKNKKLIIIPIANPDGYYDRTDKLNANKVNLNLNFKTSYWRKYGPEGTYAGKEPFSEIESQVLKEVVETYKPNGMVAYHSQGALVSPELEEPSKALAKWYAKKVGYDYFTHWDFPGTATKWFEENYHKPAITVEISKQLQSDWEINKPALMELISSDSIVF